MKVPSPWLNVDDEAGATMLRVRCWRSRPLDSGVCCSATFLWSGSCSSVAGRRVSVEDQYQGFISDSKMEDTTALR